MSSPQVATALAFWTTALNPAALLKRGTIACGDGLNDSDLVASGSVTGCTLDPFCGLW